MDLSKIGTWEIVGGAILDDTTTTNVIFTLKGKDGEDIVIKRAIPHFKAHHEDEFDEILELGINNRMITEARALGLID